MMRDELSHKRTLELAQTQSLGTFNYMPMGIVGKFMHVHAITFVI